MLVLLSCIRCYSVCHVRMMEAEYGGIGNASLHSSHGGLKNNLKWRMSLFVSLAMIDAGILNKG